MAIVQRRVTYHNESGIYHLLVKIGNALGATLEKVVVADQFKLDDGGDFLGAPDDEGSDDVHEQRPNQQQTEQPPKSDFQHTNPYTQCVRPARTLANQSAAGYPLPADTVTGTLKLRPVPHKQKPRAVADAGFSLAA